MEDFRKTYKEKYPNNKTVSVTNKAGGKKWNLLSDAKKGSIPSPRRVEDGRDIKMAKGARGKVYVVFIGWHPSIYQTWAECEVEVLRYPCAIYQCMDVEHALAEFLTLKSCTEPKPEAVPTSLVVRVEAEHYFTKHELRFSHLYLLAILAVVVVFVAFMLL
ncbi:hypothetical protein GIB67_018444 [Kingdonia uniflora]|uniref:Ribonuclease H1 N-terminal domain-containing protein n=1 Tax=Kingdonia uniflora TaxID=39325 RepID=A0A7J7LJC9_9MAGN|nr:hypothetical protein GIB67_018444 [Kingdonia uniflora]